MIIFKIGGGKDINREGIAKGLSLVHEPAIVHGPTACGTSLALKTGYDQEGSRPSPGLFKAFFRPRADRLDDDGLRRAGEQKVVETLQRHGINAVGLTGF